MTDQDPNQIRALIREALDGAVVSQAAAGTRAIAGFTEWISKADADYSRVLSELAELKLRVAKLEQQQ